MNKRLLSLICAVAIVIGMIVPGSSSVKAAVNTTSWETQYVNIDMNGTTCPMCEAQITGWTTLTANTDLTAGGHYKLTANTSKSIELEGMTICLDLAGLTLTTRITANADAVVNIVDSSAEKTGILTGNGNSGFQGGVIYVRHAKAVVNTYNVNMQANTGVIAYRGGIVSAVGKFNMYGGKLIGGTLGGTSTNTHVGAAVSVANGGELNLQDAIILNGRAEADDLGHGVYVNDGGKVKLSGKSCVEQLLFSRDPATALTFSGAYTGAVELYCKTPVALDEPIGISNNADVSAANITVKGMAVPAIAVNGGYVVIGRRSRCEHCNRSVVWQAMGVSDFGAVTSLSTGHYYLKEDVTFAKAKDIVASATVCLDLNGHTLKSNAQVFKVTTATEATKKTLNIMDRSKKMSGVMSGGITGEQGGAIFNYRYNVVNLYGGTIQGSDTETPTYGGAISTQGPLNMHGGKIIGGTVSASGGAIFASPTGSLNLQGGTIQSGTAATGNCVALSTAAVELSRDATVDEIYFSASDITKTNLTITGIYTGKVSLAYVTTPATGTTVGTVAAGATIPVKESISISGTRSIADVNGNNLVVSVATGASVTTAAGAVNYYSTLAEAVGAWTEGAIIKLQADNAENVTLSNGTVLDLNGWNMTGDVTVNGTVYVKDTCTDDYSSNDIEGYGVISGDITGSLEAAEGYLAIADNGISVHKYSLKINQVSLRPGATGMYYGSSIVVDEKVQDKMVRFGVAVSVNSQEPSAEPANETSLYTVYKPVVYGTTTNSVLINAVMEETDPPEAGKAYAATDVYGRGYLVYSDANGQHYVYGDVFATNLQALTETVDSKAWDSLSLTQNRAMMQMRKTFGTVMADWRVTNMASAFNKEQKASSDNTLKVLIIGNSHSLDSTHMLYEVFDAEGYMDGDQELVVGALYYQGCRISQHVDYLTNDSASYDYYKDTSANAGKAWTPRKETTMQYALQDENWDIVVLQEMNAIAAILDNEEGFIFGNDDIEILSTYVVKKMGYEPKFLWNMIWSNPVIPQEYADYAMNQESGDDEYIEGDGTGDANDPASKTWVFKDAMLGSRIYWVQRQVRYWQNDRQNMYEDTVTNTKKYVIGHNPLDFSADDIIPCATAVQYALEHCGITEDGSATNGDALPGIYRDYTHMSDFGRVMIAYLWYAELTGMQAGELTEIKYNVIPNEMRQKNFKNLNTKDVTLTNEQITAIKDAVNYALNPETKFTVPVPQG